MVSCPRCRNMVDERATRVCPHCSTPLQAAASPQPSPPTAPGNASGVPSAGRAVRTSLTGEILEDAPVAPPAANSPYANSQMGRTGMGAVPPRAAPTAYSRRETEPDNSGRKAFVINMTMILLLLALCGGGGYWKWMHRTEPKAQVQRYIHAIQWLDWGVVWDLSAEMPGGKHRREFISMMEDKFDNNGVLNIAARKSMEKIPFEIGEPSVAGNEATVPVTRGATKLDAAKNWQFKLTNYGGVWKIHPLVANPLDLIHDPIDEKELERKLQSITPGPGGMPTIQ